MNELNMFGIKYCKPPSENNFLLFNKIHFSEFGNKKIIDEEMKLFLGGMSFEDIKIVNYNHDNFSFLCTY